MPTYRDYIHANGVREITEKYVIKPFIKLLMYHILSYILSITYAMYNKYF